MIFPWFGSVLGVVFSDLTLLVVFQETHPACKQAVPFIPKELLLLLIPFYSHCTGQPALAGTAVKD